MSNATVYQGFQLGAESTPGTNVTAGKRLLSLSCTPKLIANPKVFKPRGQKYKTGGGVNRMWVQADLEGDLDYNAATYLLAGLVKSTSATGTAAPYTWGTYISDPDAPDSVKAFTGQVGYQLGIWKWTYGFVAGLKLMFDENGGKVQSTMFGKSISGTIITASGSMDSATNVAMLSNLAHHNTLYATPTYGSLGSSSIGYRKFEWALEDKFGPAFFVKGTSDFTDSLDRPEPKNTIKMTVEWNATTSAWISQFKLGTTMYYRHTSTDGTNSLTINGAALIQSMDYGDEDGIAVVTIGMEGQRDTNISSGSITSAPFKIDLINGINAL